MKMKTFEKIDNFYDFSLKIKLETPLHVGSSSEGISPLDVDNLVIRINDRPFIPGSSIKGVFRSTLEFFLRSINEKLACDVVGDKPCIDIKDEEFKKLKELEKVKYIDQNACDVCKLFGSNFISSKVEFEDAYAKDEIVISNRDGVAISRETESAEKQKKYDYEVVNPGSIFETHIIGRNLEDYEVGYILSIIALVNDGYAKFGGKKSAGLGRVKIDFEISKTDFSKIDDTFGKQHVDRSNYQKAVKDRLEAMAHV
jgi:CRISPR-associated RAMP protein (TIGR02581 family)